VTVYDLLRNLFLYERMKSWWLYEHIYKMISSFSALFSAFAGTALPRFKPYSQVGPSAICMILVVVFIIGQWKKRNRLLKGNLTAQRINSGEHPVHL
jgi:hypothetical protein